MKRFQTSSGRVSLRGLTLQAVVAASLAVAVPAIVHAQAAPKAAAAAPAKQD